MTQPPEDRYGSPRYGGQRPRPLHVLQQPPQQRQPRQPQPPTAGAGYWDPPQQLPPQPQPGWQPPPQSPPYGNDYPYEETPPGAYDYGPPGAYDYGPPGGSDYGPPGGYDYAPPGGYDYVPPAPQQESPRRAAPRRAARSKTKRLVLILGTFVALLLAAGGAYYLVGGQGGGGSTGADAQREAPPEQGRAGEQPGDGKSGGAQNNDAPGAPGKETGGKNFVGKWQSGSGETLTVGKVERSGKAAGKSAVSYDRPGRLSTCRGIGESRKSGAAFRLALKCDNGEVTGDLGGDALRSGDKLTVEWDGGSRQTLTGEGN